MMNSGQVDTLEMVLLKFNSVILFQCFSFSLIKVYDILGELKPVLFVSEVA